MVQPDIGDHMGPDPQEPARFRALAPPAPQFP